MKRFVNYSWILLGLLFVVVAGCSSESTGAPPPELTSNDSSRLVAVASDYVGALVAGDAEKARTLLRSDVPEEAVNKAITTVHDQGWQFVSVSSVQPSSDGVDAVIELIDKNNQPVTRALEFKVDQGALRLWSPQLKAFSN